MPGCSARPGPAGVGRHGAGHEPRLAVEFGGNAMHRANECALAAADDPRPELPL